jgi:hypothetical protein
MNLFLNPQQSALLRASLQLLVRCLSLHYIVNYLTLSMFSGNTINVNPETGVVQMDCKGLTLGRFYYVRTCLDSRSFLFKRISLNTLDQVRISSSNVLGFGPARVLLL